MRYYLEGDKSIHVRRDTDHELDTFRDLIQLTETEAILLIASGIHRCEGVICAAALRN